MPGVLLLALLASPLATAQSTMLGMDHGDMRGQGGSAPADARDPHAYAGGTTLSSGPYALGTERSLVMGDEHSHGLFLVDRLEVVRGDAGDDTATGVYDLMARWGHEHARLVLKAEGEVVDGRLAASSTEALWSRAVAPYWDTQLGLRHDTTDAGKARDWLAVGIDGLAPYWFEIGATAYLGESGRTALGLSVEYELLLAQRLVLQPRLEAEAYGRRDAANGIGQGLSGATAGLRLRYEFSRQLAPYVGAEWAGHFGETADLLRAAGAPVRETRTVAGLRFWF
ncbi:copper resistance protein B [Hylemonella gracilis]